MKLYNTLTRTKEELQPLKPGEVSLYTCGLTVYSQPHIGNWVSYVYWDVLQRALEAEGYNVRRIQNITDVGHLVSDDDNGEDKMEKGARSEGMTAWEVATKYINIADKEAYELLQLKKPTLIRATDCINEQIAFVQDLETKGYTYTIDGEGVYFDASQLDDYGKLARLDIAGLQEGARVRVNGKRNSTDFALWKFSPQGAQRDMEWDSPWGKGFPGWHLECSVIAREHLGDQIDIHTGGIDHIPVHHTNEIAQTESATGKPFATFWVHNNHIKIDGGKMAKSKGNVYTLQDVLDKDFEIDAFKLMLLSKHYRTEGNFTWDILDAAQNRLENWQKAAAYGKQKVAEPDEDAHDTQLESDIKAALADDLDTPRVSAIIDKHISKHSYLSDRAVNNIKTLTGIDLTVEDLEDELQRILIDRGTARSEKQWELSDTLRDVLAHHRVTVLDTGDTQLWHRTREKTYKISRHITYADFFRSFSHFGVDLGPLPRSLVVDGITYKARSEFHITLISLKRTAPLVAPNNARLTEKELHDAFIEYLSSSPIDTWSLSDEYREVQDGTERSIVVMVEVPGLNEFFEQMSARYKVAIPPQPAHITLYTHASQHGISINSQERLQAISRPIQLDFTVKKI